ncbi:MAG: metal ABC transporter substrate-binding protein [Deltaproteobacteria bacterium]|jgi:zinc transport system substrate-binding protein|nr:metal ABC transporter substrate-binding protein [Deltaproteobacteria bacterium]
MKLRSAAFVVLLGVCSLLPLPARGAPESLRIVAGTELIADIARDLLGGSARILTLVPASSCPGHHDVRAADLAFISKADAVILHEWQRRQKPIADAIQAAGNPAGPSFVGPALSWLIPENQIAASRSLAALFSAMPGVNAKRVADKLAQRLGRIAETVAAYEKALAPYAGSPVMASLMQADFVRRLGMNVVADYGRAEDSSPGSLMRLVEAGKKSGVRVVVDNMQSGAEAGAPLAGEIGAAHVAFSNFPLFVQDVPDYETLLRHNCDLLAAALKGRAGTP